MKRVDLTHLLSEDDNEAYIGNLFTAETSNDTLDYTFNLSDSSFDVFLKYE